MAADDTGNYRSPFFNLFYPQKLLLMRYFCGKKTLRLSVGSIFPKGPGKIYFYRYQLKGRRKTVSLQTANRTEAIRKAEALLAIIKASSTEVIAAHVQQARGLSVPTRDLSLDSVRDFYSAHPDRAKPATVNEEIQYRTTLQEFIRFIGKPQMEVRKITCQHTEQFAQYLKSTGIAVYTHNRKIKRLRKIFSTLSEFRDTENPFRTILFRREREEQDLGVRRLAFSRDQEQKILEVLENSDCQVLNKPEIRLVYHLGMYTGQRLKDCALLRWSSIDLERRRIWVKQFKTGNLSRRRHPKSQIQLGNQSASKPYLLRIFYGGLKVHQPPGKKLRNNI